MREPSFLELLAENRLELLLVALAAIPACLALVLLP